MFSMAGRGALLLLLLLAHSESADALFGLEGAGGTFRYGHIFWERIQGNEVQFTIQAAFSRNVDTSYFKGSALDGFAQTGDKIIMTGRETPMFDFGDDFEQRLDNLEMTVIAYSVSENWVLGEKVLPGHVYQTPNNEGREGFASKPWLARFTGCCRLGLLVNNADSPWVLTAEVDLQKALASPRVGVLPHISVPSTAFKDPFTPSTLLNGPSFRVPGASAVPQEDRCDRRVKLWELEKPWSVGTAARFKMDSSVELPFEGAFSTTNAMSCCTSAASCPANSVDAGNPSVSGGCLFRLLRSDNQQRALTVEGWVRIDRPEGGVVMRTGKAANKMCSPEMKGVCDVSLMQVHVNATHITAGHEMYMPSMGEWKVQSVSFAVDSNEMLLGELNDPQYYTPSDHIHDKWVHVAVVRKTNTIWTPGSGLNYFSEWFSTYKVYVNGHALETQRFTGCTRTTASPECEGRPGGAFYGFEGTSPSQRDEFSSGESDLVPGPRLSGPYADGDYNVVGRCKWNELQDPNHACVDGFGNETALLFGMFEGDLDEWRFWNGARSQTDIQTWFQRPLSPTQSVYYGDPTTVTTGGGVVTASNFQTVSLLVAGYNFDWDRSQIGSCEGTDLEAGCAFQQLKPVFPAAPEAKWTAMASNDVRFVDTGRSRLMFYESGELFQLEEGGVIRFKQAMPIPIGLYQVTVRVAIESGMPRVPVDFIVEVLNQDGFAQSGSLGILGDALCNIPGQACLYNTTLNSYAPTLSISGNIAGVMTGDEAHCDVGSYVTSTARFVKGGEEQAVGLLDVNDFVYPNRLRAYAGFEMALTFHGEDSQQREGVRDAVDSQVGFSVGPAPAYGRFSTVKGTNPSEMKMEWTPCTPDVTSILCVEAVDRHVDRAQSVVGRSAASQSKCVALQVERDPAPMFLGERSRTVNYIMGKPTSFELIAVEPNALDDIEIEAVSELPPGATLSHGEYACVHCVNKSVTMSWTPGQAMGGFVATLRFKVTDTGGACSGMMGQVDYVNVTVAVAKCKYMVQKDMQLQELAAIFGMDWIRLWSLNSMEPSLNHPDYLVLAEPAQVINVGHNYRVLAGTESLAMLTKRFGMTMEQLRQLNYDIQDATEVEEGARLCVVPNSCTGQSQTIYSGLQYQDNKFLHNAAPVFDPPHTQ